MNIPIINNRTVMLGAVIGKNITEIATGVAELVPNLQTDPFFRRLTNPHLGVQTAMILLRLCGVPKMNYLLRVTPPEAIKELAAAFDEDALYIAHQLLDTVGDSNAQADDITQQLQAPLRLGGFGITSAAATSHTAYLASVASALPVAALHAYTQANHPLPTDTMLHTQLSECITTISSTTPSCSEVLPDSASNFFSHYGQQSATISKLQSTLNKRATQQLFDAAVDRAELAGDMTTTARLKAITAHHAADWKATLPTNSHTTLSDAHYRIAARFNLGLPVSGLPADCSGCAKGGKNKVAQDPYHYLSCNRHKRQEITLGHDMLVHVVYLYNQYTGGTGVKEPRDLHGSDNRRPDLQMIVNNTHILTDIQITNPLCPTSIKYSAAQQQLHAAQKKERVKSNKYTGTALQHHAKFIPFIMEATGGMSESARQIYEMIVLASRDNNTLWPHEIIARDFRGAIAIDVSFYSDVV